MIYNRTQFDVDNAIQIRSDKVQKNIALTDEDVATLEKGMMTVNTLNRIESKQAEMVSVLNTMGYYDISIVNRVWSAEEIFKLNDFVRIVKNCNKIKEAFFVFASTPPTPKIKFYFENVNSIEKILADIEAMANQIKEMYNICGTIECGEV